jgi:hypothetical protein
MMQRFRQHDSTQQTSTPVSNRRGMAIIITLILTVALGALALSSVYLASNTKISGGLSERASNLQFAADAGLQIGKSYINADPDAMPSSGYREMTFNGGILKDAAGNAIQGVRVRVWAGPTGATSGQFGAFGSVIAEATDLTGGRVVRRLELAQENFSRFAYWSNKENRGTGPLWFNSGDVIFGPMWSNDTIRIANKGALPFAAQFRDVVGTAKMVIGPTEADWWKGYSEYAIPISMPLPGSLSSLSGYATSGRMNFNAPTSGDETTVRMRIEFVNYDIDGDGSDKDPQDGFFRVYDATSGGQQENWVRGDTDSDDNQSTLRKALCGEWITIDGAERFFPVAAHENATAINSWLNLKGVSGAIRANFVSGSFPGATASSTIAAILSKAAAGNRSQCFLGGAPELNFNVGGGIWGGTSRTFSPNDSRGGWRAYTGPIDARVTAAAAPGEAPYLFPLHRSVNSGARGVISVSGTVGVSGALVGRVTLRSTGSIVVLDDIKYGTNPAATGQCVDVLGLLSEKDVVVADNMLNDQVDVWVGTGTTTRKLLDDSKDLTLHAVVMAMDRSFRVERYDQLPDVGNPCNGVERGRGCLALLGGIIQEARGAVTTFSATKGTGYLKQYTYDRCANLRPPPYFPTTGRFLDNRYMEIDPVNFDIATLFARLQPLP